MNLKDNNTWKFINDFTLMKQKQPDILLKSNTSTNLINKQFEILLFSK